MGDVLDLIQTGAREHPDAGFVVGYAVYTLMKFGRHLEAFGLAQACRSSDWWCALVQGMVFQGVERLDAAEERFRVGLETAPDSIACQLAEASWALNSRVRGRLAALPCEDRLAASDTVWWLADPLFAVERNDRWSEHVSRSFQTRSFFLETIHSNVPGPMPEWLREFYLPRRIPRGTWDSWKTDGLRIQGIPMYNVWTSAKAARYHFVPDFPDGDLSQPVWRLDATLEDEGYTPPYGPFFELPAQIARFRRADSLLVVVAGDLVGSPLADAPDATAHLVLSNAPDSFPVQLASAIHDQRAVFLAQIPPIRYVTSFEVLSGAGMGRHRVMTDPLDVEGPGISDVLFYRPAGNHEPDSLLIAAGMMLGTTTLAPDDSPGVYWETYGVPPEAPVSIEIEVRREGRGLFSEITRVLPGVGGQERGRLSWTEPSPGAVFRNAVVLDLEGLDEGSYTLVVRTSWPAQEALVTERAFEVR